MKQSVFWVQRYKIKVNCEWQIVNYFVPLQKILRKGHKLWQKN